MSWRQVILAWDFLLSLFLGIVVFLALRPTVSNELAKDLYGMGVSVASIVFSVFFTALAVIMTASDDDFVKFLRKANLFLPIMRTFELTLVILFCGLVASIVGFSATAAALSHDFKTQPSWLIAAFTVLFFWGLFAAANATRDSLRYSKHRGRYMDAVTPTK